SARSTSASRAAFSSRSRLSAPASQPTRTRITSASGFRCRPTSSTSATGSSRSPLRSPTPALSFRPHEARRPPRRTKPAARRAFGEANAIFRVENLTPAALSSLTRPAAAEPEGALVLFHGRGADEQDLFPLLDLLDPERRRLGVTPRAPLSLP